MGGGKNERLIVEGISKARSFLVHGWPFVFLVGGCLYSAKPMHDIGGNRQVHPIEIPHPPNLAFSVDANALGHERVFSQIKHRTRSVRVQEYWISHRIPARRPTEPTSASVLPVIDADEKRLRVVIDDGRARIAVWIERVAAEQSVLATVQLSDKDGRGPRGFGVWVKPGVRLTKSNTDNGRMHIELIDDSVAASGWIPVRMLGEVWLEDRNTLSKNKATGTRAVLNVGEAVRESANTEAPVIATTTADVNVTVVSHTNEWTEIEVESSSIYVHGFVPATRLRQEAIFRKSPGPDLSTGGFELPVGTCLFAGLTGEIIGVNVSKHVSTLRETPIRRGWWLLGVQSPWGRIDVHVRDVLTNPQHPSWESCAP